MMNPYIQRIQKVYPEIIIHDVEVNDIGQNNDVFIINQSLVFRFPKYAEDLENLKRESQLLKWIRGKVTLSIPDPIYSSFDEMAVGKVFMGYPLIEGQPFWKEQWLKCRGTDAENLLAKQLVTFLIQLHAVDLDETLRSQMKVEHIHADISRLYTQIQDQLFRYIRQDAQEEISKNFTAFLNHPSHTNIQQTCIHGDFGTSNILWNPEEARITGIIDFGGSGIGDPAYDFAGILSGYGEELFRKCMDIYPNGAQIAERVYFYRSTFALQEALHGLEHEDAGAFEAGIRDYR